VIGVFGLLSVGECHHVLRAIVGGGYNPGVLTSIPFAVIGWLLISSAWREHRQERSLDPAHAMA
jgi:hypothetical protein